MARPDSPPERRQRLDAIPWCYDPRPGARLRVLGPSLLLALVRIRADDHDRHGGLPDDALRYAPKEQAADRSATVAAEDDDVGPLGGGGFEDRFARLAFPNEELDRDTFAATPLHELLRGGLAVFADLVDAGEEAAARQSKGGRVDDAHDEEFGPKSAGDRECFIGCRQRRP